MTGQITLSQVVPFYDTVLVDGALTNPTGGVWGYVNFGVVCPAMTAETYIELVVEFEPNDDDAGLPYAYLYSVNSDFNPDESIWYYLDEPRGRTSTTISMLAMPGLQEFDEAVTEGETLLHVEIRGVNVLRISWTVFPANGEQGSTSWASAPELLTNTASVATPKGPAAPSQGLTFEATEGGQVWWKHTCIETGYYRYDALGSATTTGNDYGAEVRLYVYEDSPVTNPLAISFATEDYEGNGYGEAAGLVHMTKSKTYYFKAGVVSYDVNDETIFYRLRLHKSMFQRLPDQGSPNYLDAPEVQPGSQSRFIDNSLLANSSVYSGMSRTVWYKFVPEQDGYISFDAESSRWRTGGGVLNSWYLEIGVYQQMPGPYELESLSNYGDVEVEAGETYYINIGVDDWINRSIEYSLRVTEFAATVRYQPPDKEIIAGWASNGNRTPTGYVIDNMFDPGFHGNMTLSRSFGGPQPGGMQDAIDCLWAHARIGSHGDYWWSPNNQIQWFSGPGTCPVVNYAYRQSQQGYTDRPIGYAFHANGWIYGDATARAFAQSQKVNVRYLWRSLTHRVGLTWQEWEAEIENAIGLPTDGWIVADDDINCTLINVQVAPDEMYDGGSSTAGIVAKWYGGLMDHSGTPQWGPHANPSNGYVDFYGGGSGANEIASQYSHLADYSGGVSPWVDVPWAAAMVLEAQAAQFDDASPYYYYDDDAGIRLVGICDELLSDATPEGVVLTTDWMQELDQYFYRAYQGCAIKVNARPSAVTATWPLIFIDGTPLPAPGDQDDREPLSPPMRQRHRDDDLATATKHQRGDGSSHQSSIRQGGRVYY